jgi:hypothetical protein
MDSVEAAITSEGNLAEQLQAVLERNWQGSYTLPAEGLYPHQWLWDSCFVAIGMSHFDIQKAQTELRSLLRGQWANGMLPHMIFSNSNKNTQDSRIWQAWRNPHAPDDAQTTGMTQPPMLAEAVVRIGEKLPLVQRRGWYQDMYPALLAHHEWLYADRDPHQEGLALLIHPWESGLDNSPPWIAQLHQHGKPTWIALVEKTKLDKVFLLLRRDTKHIPPGQRLNSIDALLYYNVLQRLRRKNWDIDAILSRSHFMVEDLAFNCIFIRANQHLQTIAKTIGRELPEEFIARTKKTEEALEKLWDGYYNQYFSRNFITHKLIKKPSIATLLPLYAGSISKQRAHELVAQLHDKKLFGAHYPVPSVPLSSDDYSELGYWQGPTWINTNWLIVDGLRRYGFQEEADFISKKSIELIEKSGSYEYFSAKSGEPAGAHNFSWSASLAIDFLKH